eukprot:160054-Pelagomonas_calceolata.AAC.1
MEQCSKKVLLQTALPDVGIVHELKIRGSQQCCAKSTAANKQQNINPWTMLLFHSMAWVFVFSNALHGWHRSGQVGAALLRWVSAKYAKLAQPKPPEIADKRAAASFRWRRRQALISTVLPLMTLSAPWRACVNILKSHAPIQSCAHTGPDQHCPAPDDFISAMEGVFNDLRNAENSNGSTSANSAETLSYVLEMVRQHKVGASDALHHQPIWYGSTMWVHRQLIRDHVRFHFLLVLGVVWQRRVDAHKQIEGPVH